MVLYRYSYKHFVIAGIILLITGCSVEKNTGSSRFYNSLTARYNIYFNALESYKAGLSKIGKSYRDDYSSILKVFEYSDASTVSMCSADMEKAIQKASKLITLKSITAKPSDKGKENASTSDREFMNRKEYNEWVDDSYLLIGKARLYKHEFTEAEKTLSFCITEANDPDIRTEASIWLARVYNETGNLSESARLLSEAEPFVGGSKNLDPLYQTTLADLMVKQKKYSLAVEPIEKALSSISGKRQKYRLTYLLAQLCEESGDGTGAIAHYREVVRFNPPYDVEFNARINIAGVFDINAGNPAEIRKELEKMLRDSKNGDYLDQIYFALGGLLMKEGNEDDAVDYYRKSAAASTVNSVQKGRSYLALADHFYNKPDYMRAGKYYDSAVFFIDQKNPDYIVIKDKSQSLNGLVSQLTIIQTEDSLQRVASLPVNDRNSIIANIISKIIKDESEGKRTDNSDRSNMGQFYENERRFQNNIQQEGKWYFYNQSALTFGRTEFRRRWGDRKLEDNWRRANKTRTNQTPGTAAGEEGENNIADTSAPENNYKKPEYYLKNLPLTDSLLTASNDRIANAMIGAAKAYDELINDKVRASDTFDALIKRFPANEMVPEALYSIYRINKDSNKARAEAAREKLLSKYPASEFALILSDPSYFDKKMAARKMSERLYDEAYTTYTAGDFASVQSMCDKALAQFPQDDLAPKFMFLKAYAVAGNGNEKGYRNELNKLITAWPAAAESKKAAEILAFLDQKTPELKVEEEKVTAREIFEKDSLATHLFAIVIPDPKFNINLATFDVISYNIDNYTNRNFRTEGSLAANKYILITVAGFAALQEAMEYYRSFNIARIIRNYNPSMMTFVISEKNLKTLADDKNPERYSLFFKENYLK